jgi:phage terminase large subunit
MQGGSRSGKTYNILIWFIAKLLAEKGKVFTIVRASLPSIKGTVMRDFVDIMTKLGLYKEANHNKTDSSYQLGTNLIEFVSIDQPQKIRGRARDYLFANECNELSYDAWLQLTMRTRGKIVIDYNPSMEYSFIYDDIIPREDADFYITTYKDNPFLDENIVAEIERLQQVDENYWRVYGLGEKGQSQLTVYTHWKYCPQLPFKTRYFYGLDFGFRAPTALVKCVIQDGAVYAKEELYETELTVDDLVGRMGQIGVSKRDNLWCDSAEPKTIETLRRHGYNARPAVKKVEEGIRKVQSMPLFITEDSINMIKEIRNYKWKVIKDSNNETPSKEEPVKLHDHALDGLRMAVHSETSKKLLQWV